MEEEEEPDEPEEEEDDDYDVHHQVDNFAGIDEEEEGGFVNRRRLGPYVTQRLPGIRSFYPPVVELELAGSWHLLFAEIS